MNKPHFSHVLQKAGVLKNFTVAKIVKKQEIEDLKALIKSVTSSDKEYNQMLSEEMKKISDMHDEHNPIPGIIYPPDQSKNKKLIVAIVTKFSQSVKKQNLSTREMAFLISAIINELGLTQEDFINLKNELEDANPDDGDDDEENDEDDEGVN
jgi:hypothetical protein